jgi:hypothetical protein
MRDAFQEAAGLGSDSFVGPVNMAGAGLVGEP